MPIRNTLGFHLQISKSLNKFPSSRDPADQSLSTLLGTRPERVVAAIRDRLFNRKSGTTTPDDRRIGLVLEGGGMRSASAAGGALALGHLGLAEIFDDIYATSAAVMNASYFMTQQEDLGISIYFDDLTTGEFCNLTRFWKILDVNHVIEDVVKNRKLLNVSKIKGSPTRLHVSVMDRLTGEGFVINTHQSPEPLTKILHAALAIPVLYNRTVEIEGRFCMDGGLAIPFPLKQAIEDGCTDILVLLSHPSDYAPSPHTWWQKLIFSALCSRGRSKTLAAFKHSHEVSKEFRDLALGKVCPATDVNIATLCTHDPPFLHRLTMNRDELMAAASAYGKRTLAALGADSSNWNLGPASSAKWID